MDAHLLIICRASHVIESSKLLSAKIEINIVQTFFTFGTFRVDWCCNFHCVVNKGDIVLCLKLKYKLVFNCVNDHYLNMIVPYCQTLSVCRVQSVL